MSLISFTESADGETADASDINTPLNTIYDDYNGNIDQNNLADGAVTAAKLATDAVTNVKVANNAIDTAELVDGAVTSDKVADGILVNHAIATLNSSSTTSSIIPFDDTIPQNTEGTEILTVSITPKSSTNILVVEAKVAFSNGAGVTDTTIAIFRDSTANAKCADYADGVPSDGTGSLIAKFSETAGATSSTTFKVRIGVNGGTVRWNGSGARRFGDIPKTSIEVWEYKAS